MPQNFRIFRELQCLVYLRTTKHRNARKIPKFCGMRCTKHCNAWKIPKIPKFRDLWPSSLHSLQKFGIFGILRALQCVVHLMPQNFGIFRSITVFGVPQSYIFFHYSMTIALLPYYFLTQLLYCSTTQILCYSITLFIYYSFLHYRYDFITLVVYLCITIVLHCY